jgi:hypothetical protein
MRVSERQRRTAAAVLFLGGLIAGAGAQQQANAQQ